KCRRLLPFPAHAARRRATSGRELQVGHCQSQRITRERRKILVAGKRRRCQRQDRRDKKGTAFGVKLRIIRLVRAAYRQWRALRPPSDASRGWSRKQWFRDSRNQRKSSMPNRMAAPALS